MTRRRQTLERPTQCGASGEAIRCSPHPYVPDCDLVEQDDGTLLVTHLASGRARTAATDRQALIVGTGLAIADTWQQVTLTPCPPTGHIGPIDVYPATATKKCRRCGQTWTWV